MQSIASFLELKYLEELKARNCPSVLDEVKSYVPKDLPERPQEMAAFYALSRFDQATRADKFFTQDIIKTYMEEKWQAELHNRDCYSRLLVLRDENNGNIPLLREIGKKISVFADAIQANEIPFPALIINVEKEVTPPQEADWADAEN